MQFLSCSFQKCIIHIPHIKSSVEGAPMLHSKHIDEYWRILNCLKYVTYYGIILSICPEAKKCVDFDHCHGLSLLQFCTSEHFLFVFASIASFYTSQNRYDAHYSTTFSLLTELYVLLLLLSFSIFKWDT